jgi:hypothetical protein
MGFSGVYTNLDAIARLGQLYLDDGVEWPQAPRRAGSPARRPGTSQPAAGTRLARDTASNCGCRSTAIAVTRSAGMVVLPEHDAVVAMFSCARTWLFSI